MSSSRPTNKAKVGRPRLEARHQTIEAQKPWLKAGMSRATWYRRRAEKAKSVAG